MGRKAGGKCIDGLHRCPPPLGESLAKDSLGLRPPDPVLTVHPLRPKSPQSQHPLMTQMFPRANVGDFNIKDTGTVTMGTTRVTNMNLST